MSLKLLHAMPEETPEPEQTALEFKDALSLLIASEGNLELAAARATKALNTPITGALILTTIAARKGGLASVAEQLKLLMLLQQYDAFRKTHMMYLERMPSLTPRDLANAYIHLSAGMNEALSTASVKRPDARETTDLDAVMGSLPAEVAEAIEFFATNKGAAAPAEDYDNYQTQTAPGAVTPGATP